MALPEDYINRAFQQPLDREIVLLLYRLRNNKISSKDIQRLCQTTHSKTQKKYGIRSIEERLKQLVAKGHVIHKKEEIDSKEGGRPKWLFSISDGLKQEIEDDVRTPNFELSSLIRVYIEKPKSSPYLMDTFLSF